MAREADPGEGPPAAARPPGPPEGRSGTAPPAAGPGTSFDALVGATLAGRYEIQRRIGEGGMGAVYEARHVVLGKRVAVKVLLEKFHERQELVARLLQEARLASAIGHENIVDVADFGTTDDGRSFIVMEFLEGESLADVVTRDAPLPVERCLRIGQQVASALSAAHDKGIVHRDVKPENVFLLRRGEQDFVKVMDFGVSKAVRSREEGVDLLRLTRTGMVLGTPLYMSPEQARGDEDIDARADVWALGVMLYESLTGEVPFRARNYLGVISQVLTETVEPPSRLRPELAIPAAVEAVVMRAMEKDRGRRYQRMEDLKRDLDRLSAGDPNVGLAPAEGAARDEADRAARRTGPRWHLAAAALVVVAAGLVVALGRGERRAAPTAGSGPVTARARATAPAPAPRAAPPAPAAVARTAAAPPPAPPPAAVPAPDPRPPPAAHAPAEPAAGSPRARREAPSRQKAGPAGRLRGAAALAAPAAPAPAPPPPSPPAAVPAEPAPQGFDRLPAFDRQRPR
jgi:serine/threonine-protein kinase